MRLSRFARYIQVWGHRFFRRFHLSETQILIILSFVVGISTGLGAVLFIWLIESAKDLFFGYSLSYLNQFIVSWKIWVPLIPLLGGLLAGPILYRWAVETRGSGVPEVMEATALRGGLIRPRVALAKSIALALCIGSGGSAGREGPIVQVGSSIGSTIGQVFKMSGQRIRVLVGCGAAAGISAVFNAPIAGVLFALEVILGDFGIRTFSPVILSSVIASVISRSLLGDHPAFDIPGTYKLISAYEIGLYILLGILTAVISILFTRVLYFSVDQFMKLKIHDYLKPALGMFMLGIVGLFLPQIFSDGYDTISLALVGELPLILMLVLVFAKILATSLTLGSGNAGGIFAPSLFMGAVAGGFFGKLAHGMFPEVTALPGAYAVVGMAGVVAGTTHAPITAILIIFEMTGNYNMILPLMVTCVFATLVSRRTLVDSIYTMKLSRKGIKLQSGRDILVLSSIKVKEVMHTDFTVIPHNMPLYQILQVVEESRDDCWPVVDAKGDLIGTFTLHDLRTVSAHPEMNTLVIAADISHSHPVDVSPEDTLEEALKKIAPRDIEVVPVVDHQHDDKLLGLLEKGDIYTAYNKKVIGKLRSSDYAE
ncbi:MAG: CBS domain-containing protein [candidate division Zixibacteria bacterium]|nr:CBS domain-containing protein [candidate division Zixibacteria bacterium]